MSYSKLYSLGIGPEYLTRKIKQEFIDKNFFPDKKKKARKNWARKNKQLWMYLSMIQKPCRSCF